jgi:hypothetical protein
VTIRIIRVTERQSEDYDRFVKDLPNGHFRQGYAWGTVMGYEGDVFRLAVERSGSFVGALSIQRKKLPGTPFSFLYAPRGPMVDYEDEETIALLFEEAHRIASDHRAIFLRLDPDALDDQHSVRMQLQRHGFRYLRGKDWSSLNYPRLLMRIDTRPDEQELLKGMRKKDAQKALKDAEVGEGGFVESSAAAHVVAAYGIEVVSEELAHSPEDAAQAAAKLGFPVALKVVSPDIPHKSDVGGVVLNLKDAQAVERAFRTVTENPRESHPQARILGALVQPMVAAGQEVIVGMARDDQFGPLMMFGLGGVEVEGLGDVAFSLAPLGRRGAERMLRETWAGRRLDGYRDLPPADREAVLQALLRLSQLVLDYPQILEVEINPLRVLPEGKGAVALDVRLRLNGEEESRS